MNKKEEFSNQHKKAKGVDISNNTDIDSILKNHLKASLNMESLEVSEDLIQRTLQKIEEAKENKDIEFTKVNLKGKRMKQLSAVAAAIVLVVTSVFVWESRYSPESNQYDYSELKVKSLDEGEINSSTQKEDNEESNDSFEISSKESGSEEFNMATIEEDGESYDTATIDEKNENHALAPEVEDKLVLPNNMPDYSGKLDTTYSLSMHTFSLLYPIETFDKVTQMGITKVDDKTVLMSGEAAVDVVEEFYNLLEEYSLTTLTDTDVNAGDDWNFDISITIDYKRKIGVKIFQDGTLLIGDNSLGDEKTKYQIEENEKFLKKVDEFYSSLY